MYLCTFSHFICFSTSIAMFTRQESPATPWLSQICCILGSLNQRLVPLKDTDRVLTAPSCKSFSATSYESPFLTWFPKYFTAPAYPIASNVLQVSIISHPDCHDSLWLGILSPLLSLSTPFSPHGQNDLCNIQIQLCHFPAETFNTSLDLTAKPNQVSQCPTTSALYYSIVLNSKSESYIFFAFRMSPYILQNPSILTTQSPSRYLSSV